MACGSLVCYAFNECENMPISKRLALHPIFAKMKIQAQRNILQSDEICYKFAVVVVAAAGIVKA